MCPSLPNPGSPGPSSPLPFPKQLAQSALRIAPPPQNNPQLWPGPCGVNTHSLLPSWWLLLPQTLLCLSQTHPCLASVLGHPRVLLPAEAQEGSSCPTLLRKLDAQSSVGEDSLPPLKDLSSGPSCWGTLEAQSSEPMPSGITFPRPPTSTSSQSPDPFHGAQEPNPPCPLPCQRLRRLGPQPPLPSDTEALTSPIKTQESWLSAPSSSQTQESRGSVLPSLRTQESWLPPAPRLGAQPPLCPETRSAGPEPLPPLRIPFMPQTPSVPTSCEHPPFPRQLQPPVTPLGSWTQHSCPPAKEEEGARDSWGVPVSNTTPPQPITEERRGHFDQQPAPPRVVLQTASRPPPNTILSPP